MARDKDMNLKISNRKAEESPQKRKPQLPIGTEIRLNGEKLTRCFNFELAISCDALVKVKLERYATDDIDRVLLTDKSELATETRTFVLMSPIALNLDVEELVPDDLD